MLAYIGIVIILFSFTLFLIPDSHRQLEKLLFFGSMCLGSGLVLISIAVTGRVPLRGPGSWPHFRERFGTALFGLLIYLALFGTMAHSLILAIRDYLR